MSDPRIPDISGKYVPGIQESLPHTSEENPYLHTDLIFNQGKLPGQLPLPFEKIHQPVDDPGPSWPDFGC